MATENEKDIMAELQKPFRAEEIEWRAQRVGVSNGRPWAMVLAYVTNRAIMNRLDEVVGIANWRNEYIKWSEGSTLCGLSLRIGGEWITKWDGAEETDIEAVKGGLSDSMKRAAVQWGMGRYLYNLTEAFAECSSDRQNGDDWRKAETKDKQTLWWKIPTLPAWALPAVEKSGRANTGGKPNEGHQSHGKNAKGDSGSNPPAQTTPPTNSMDPEVRINNLLVYMNGIGVGREDIENMIKPLAEFGETEFSLVRSAARLMRESGMTLSFAQAVTEVTR